MPRDPAASCFCQYAMSLGWPKNVSASFPRRSVTVASSRPPNPPRRPESAGLDVVKVWVPATPTRTGTPPPRRKGRKIAQLGAGDVATGQMMKQVEARTDLQRLKQRRGTRPEEPVQAGGEPAVGFGSPYRRRAL